MFLFPTSSIYTGVILIYYNYYNQNKFIEVYIGIRTHNAIT
jgi:hypothetical protein